MKHILKMWYLVSVFYKREHEWKVDKITIIREQLAVCYVWHTKSHLRNPSALYNLTDTRESRLEKSRVEAVIESCFDPKYKFLDENQDHVVFLSEAGKLFACSWIALFRRWAIYLEPLGKGLGTWKQLFIGTGIGATLLAGLLWLLKLLGII
ncbi:MAG: hypothetical protein AAB602_03760 [Patescibacteria group bacterium]